jgi:cytochrome P450
VLVTAAAQRAIDAIPGPATAEGHNGGDIAAAGGLYHFMLALHERHGAVARFWLDPQTPVVSIADPVLLAETVRIGDRPVALFRFLEPLIGNLQVLPAAEAREQRKLIIPALGHARVLEDSFAPLAAKVARVLARWERLADAGASVLLQKELTELSFDMIGTVAFGAEFDTPELGAAMTGAFNDVLHEFLLQQFGLPTELGAEERRARCTRGLAYVRETTRAVVARRASAPPREDARHDLLDALLASGLPVDQVELNVIGVLLAGFHTTGIGVSWALHLLAEHPEALARAEAEVDAVFTGAPRLADLDRLPYLGKVLDEAMRRFPPAPFAARVATAELRLGGFTIPAGTTLFYPIAAIHRDARYWPDPERFDPERFAEDAVRSRPPLAFVPFGIGSRSCSGMKLALVEMKLLLAMILKAFRVRSLAGHPVVPIDRFVLWSRDDIRAALTRRQCGP